MSDFDDKSPIRDRKRSRSRSMDSDDRGARGRGGDSYSKRRFNDDGRIEMRLLIHSKDAGIVIGRGGSNIKRLRQDFHSSVNVSDSRTPERILQISGELKSVVDVCEEIFILYEDKYKTERRDYEVEAKMLIHQSQAGCVIGKAGNKMKELRQEHGVDVKVYSMCCPRSSERIVKVIGHPKSISRCFEEILQLLSDFPPKGHVTQYDPINYDSYSVREYGGYADDERGKMRGDRGGDRDGGMRDGGRRGGGGGGGSYRGDDRGRRDRDDDRGGRMSSGSSGPRSSQQVSIPADLAGVIIGRGGQNIRQIRQDSGAEIELSDPTGDADRIITITGSQDQIQNAQYMLQMSVKQHLAKDGRR